ncbi:MAG: hypothetical protein ACK4N5_16530, partial [Myxococcales bacterium]
MKRMLGVALAVFALGACGTDNEADALRAFLRGGEADDGASLTYLNGLLARQAVRGAGYAAAGEHDAE